jgi:hypothetical protein
MSPTKWLKSKLGHTYGGPSLSYENNEFILYTWTDAPVGEQILAKGKTLKELMENYEEQHEKSGKLDNKKH